MKRSVVFLTKADCELCDVGHTAVATAARLTRVDVDVIDIASAGGRYDRYAERVPVLLDDAGRTLDEGPIGLVDAMAALVRLRLRR